MKCDYCGKDNLVALKDGYNVEVGFFLCMDCHGKYKKGNEEINNKFNDFLEGKSGLKLKDDKKKTKESANIINTEVIISGECPSVKKTEGLIKKCPYCAEEIEDSAIKCKHCKTFLKANINENAVKNFSCRICGKGQMLESIKMKHMVWPGICCIIISIILFVIAIGSIPNIFYESMASTYYVQGYLHENSWISIVMQVGIILFLFGIVFSFVYKKQVHGWKCDYCGNFIEK